MAKDPAFLFYPGDYLRDTQAISSNSQVAYDRIMCEHMRNIAITQRQLDFFTKRLTGDEKEELMLMLTEVDGGYCIEWVAESINKRRSYCESRRKNRSKKNAEDMKTYDPHMENENENINENINSEENSEKPNKHKYGEYQHVLLTDEWRDGMINDWGKREFERMVKSLDEAIEEHGYKYKNHNLTMRKWRSKDLREGRAIIMTGKSGGNAGAEKALRDAEEARNSARLDDNIDWKKTAFGG